MVFQLLLLQLFLYFLGNVMTCCGGRGAAVGARLVEAVVVVLLLDL